MENEKRMIPGTVRPKAGLDLFALVSAGVIGGALSLIVTALASAEILGSPDFMLRLAASIVLGPGVIPLSEAAGIAVLGTGTLVYLGLSLLYAGIIAVVIHRWGLVAGFIGGGLIGLALYFINLYAFTFAFPWIYPLRSWIVLAGYVAYGALAGTIYELLDEDDLDLTAATEAAW